MKILDIVYSSAPTDIIMIPTIEINHPSFDPIRICAGFNDVDAMLETSEQVTFVATGMDIALPAKDQSGQQVLTFAIDNVMGEVQQAIDASIDAGGQAKLIYRVYLSTDLSEPAEPPLEMTIVGGVLEGSVAQIQAAYYDLLNTAWPRERYTAKFAPCIRYM